MNKDQFLERREKLRALFPEKGLSALLVSHAANRFYLSGFELHDPQCNETAGWLLITKDEGGATDLLLTDPRYEDAAKRLWPEEQIYIYSSAGRDKTRQFIKSRVGGTIGVESRSLNIETFRFLAQDLALEPTVGLVEQLRIIKEPEEVITLERSISLNHQVMRRAPDMLVPGTTEMDVSWEVEKAFREIGATELSFPSIVAVGPNAALPHHIPGHDVVGRNSLVLIDCGGRFENYCSDQTRTFWVGDKVPDRFTRTREYVQEAQNKAIESIRPGVPIADVYKVARNCFASHSVETRFTHALGHGIGLETHEPPSVGPNTPGELQAGMVITVEPGLYYPDWGGIRWEFMIHVTEEGARIL